MTRTKLRRIVREFFTFVPPVVGAASLVVMTGLGLGALRTLGQTWAVSVTGALGAALVSTLLLYAFLNAGNRSRSDVRYYLGKRLLTVAIGTAVVAVALHFLLSLDWLVCFAASPALAIVGIGIVVAALTW